MKNADMPAMPTSPNSSDPEWAAARTGGLTKREIFAMHAMQGLASAHTREGHWSHDHSIVAEAAVCYADALLKELAK